MTKIYIASDHAGVELKSQIVTRLQDHKWLPELKREIFDLGPQSLDSVDYSDFADLVAKKIHGFSLVSSGDDAHPTKTFPTEIGILLCGSGEGMCMRANRYAQIRAALAWDPESARLSREHNDANVLCLGARLISPETCLQIVQIF